MIPLLGGCFTSGTLVTERIVQDARRRQERAAGPTATSTPIITPATFTPSPTRTPQPGRSLAQVVRVWDGNTILIDGGYSVRLIGVEAPGAGMFRRPLEPFGREAAERLVELLEGGQVELEWDQTDVDAAGNLLRWVWVDDILVNDLLIREGLARVGSFGANRIHDVLLREAEAEARFAPVNIWTIITPTFTITATRTETLYPTYTSYPTPIIPPMQPAASPVVLIPRPPTATIPATITALPSRTPTRTVTRTVTNFTIPGSGAPPR
jgi:micrococcal nuclease